MDVMALPANGAVAPPQVAAPASGANGFLSQLAALLGAGEATASAVPTPWAAPSQPGQAILPAAQARPAGSLTEPTLGRESLPSAMAAEADTDTDPDIDAASVDARIQAAAARPAAEPAWVRIQPARVKTATAATDTPTAASTQVSIVSLLRDARAALLAADDATTRNPEAAAAEGAVAPMTPPVDAAAASVPMMPTIEVGSPGAEPVAAVQRPADTGTTLEADGATDTRQASALAPATPSSGGAALTPTGIVGTVAAPAVEGGPRLQRATVIPDGTAPKLPEGRGSAGGSPRDAAPIATAVMPTRGAFRADSLPKEPMLTAAAEADSAMPSAAMDRASAEAGLRMPAIPTTPAAVAPLSGMTLTPAPSTGLAEATLMRERPALPAADPAPVLAEQVVDMLDHDTWQARMRLDPPSLGEVEVHIAVREGQVALSLGSTDAQARLLLAQSLPELASQLAARGLQLMGADVGDPSSGRERAPERRLSRRSADEDTADSLRIGDQRQQPSGLMDGFA